MEKIGESVKIRKIAITGIGASGKSAVCNILKEIGAYVISSDEVVHRLYSQDKEVQAKVIREFGQQITSQGRIDREKLGRLVFQDKEALKRLEEIVHPYVKNIIRETYNSVKDQKYSAFVVEVPLLFEMGFEEWFDKNITVTSPEEECRSRFETVFGLGSFDRRMAFQMPQREKARRADCVIENNGSLSDLKQRALNCLA